MKRVQECKVVKSVMKTGALVGALLLLPSFALAAGLGKLTVLSGLGQPLRAEIELVSMQKGEADSLNVGLAAAEVFRKANIEYSAALLSIKFNIGRRGDERYVVVLTSTQPMHEPFLNLLVELDWTGGRLVREYTFLLDPPEYKGPKGAAPVIAAPVLSPAPAPKPVEVQRRTESATGIASGERPVAPKAAVTYEVKPGDTLAKIANANKVEGISLAQMLIALHRSNADAFDGNNINRMRIGKILNIPDRDAVAAVDSIEALRTVTAHNADFNEYRRKLGAAVVAAPERDDAHRQSVSGKITAQVEDKPAPAKEAGDQLKLSKAEDPGTPGAKRSQQGLQEDLLAKEKALKEAVERIALLEKNMGDMQKLLELKSQAAAQLQQQAMTTAAASAPAQAVAAPKAAPKAVAPPPPPELSLVDAMLQNELVLYGGSAFLLSLLGGYAYYARRRKSALQSGENGGIGGAPAAERYAASAGRGADWQKAVDLGLQRDPGNSLRGGTEVAEARVASAPPMPIGAKIAAVATMIPPEDAGETGASGEMDFDPGVVAPAPAAAARVAETAAATAAETAAETTTVGIAIPGEVTTTAAAADTTMAGIALTAGVTTTAEGEQSGLTDTGAASAPEVAADLGFNLDLGADPNQTDAGAVADQADAGAVQDLEAQAAALALVAKKDGEPEFDQPDAGAVQDLEAQATALALAAKQGGEPEFDFTLRLAATDEELPALPLNLSAISLDLGSPGDAAAPADTQWQEVATKLDLARAYQEMGDKDGARELLREVLAQGDAAQRQQAQTMLSALG